MNLRGVFEVCGRADLNVVAIVVWVVEVDHEHTLVGVNGIDWCGLCPCACFYWSGEITILFFAIDDDI